jgi:hypothetical protein
MVRFAVALCADYLAVEVPQVDTVEVGGPDRPARNPETMRFR